VDDVVDGEQPLLCDEAVEVGEEYPLCRPVAVGQGGELYECSVGLFLAHALPAGIVQADIEWVVVSESSFHV
jgi:hypothetical protein